MDAAELGSSLRTAGLTPGEVVYVERRGDSFTWARMASGSTMQAAPPSGGAPPDAWLFYAGGWPEDPADDDGWRAFLDDLLAELDSMATGEDRCRWPLAEPWSGW